MLSRKKQGKRKKVSIGNLKVISILATLTTLQIYLTAAVETPSGPRIDQVKHRDQVTSAQSVGKLSMAGGAQLVAIGSGFATEPLANTISYNPTSFQLPQTSQANSWMIQAPPISSNDEFYSDTAAGKLAFTAPSVMDLYGAPSLHEFNGISGLPNGKDPLIVQSMVVTNQDTQQQLWCVKNEMECATSYQRNYTPILRSISPNQQVAGQHVDWYIDIKKVHKSTPSWKRSFEDLRIGGTIGDVYSIKYNYRCAEFSTCKFSMRNGDQMPSKDASVLARFYAGDTYPSSQARHCTYDASECWLVRSHPKIESVSASTGSTAGGQTLTFTGFGFDTSLGQTLSVTVAGIPCTVQNPPTMEEFTCVTGASPTASQDGVLQAGQVGLQRLFTNDGVTTPENILVFETPNTNTNSNSQVINGWFKAPATSNYKFYVACDDTCSLSLDAINSLSTGIEPVLVEIAKRDSWTSYQNYHAPMDTTDPLSEDAWQSGWIPLVAGELYKIQGKHWESSGDEHFSVSVEIEGVPPSQAHPHATRELQQFVISQDNVAEEWELVINNPDDGKFHLYFQDPITLNYVKNKDEIPANASASTMYRRLKDPFYNKISDILVTKVMYDIAGLETSDSSLAVQSKYTIKVLKRLNQDSFLFALSSRVDTFSTITINKLVQSSAPLAGKFTLNCPDPSNPLVIYSTEPMNYDISISSLQNRIDSDIANLIGKVEVKAFKRANEEYYENGRRFTIMFREVEEDTPQCTIASDIAEPLTGGTNLALLESTLRDYGQSMMFEPIPAEMLRAEATKPQIMVTLDGLEAACASCDYLYTDLASSVDSQSLTGQVLSITGTNLPAIGSIESMSIGEADCDTISGSSTALSCTLLTAPTAGDWNVELVTSEGLIPLAAGVLPVNVSLLGTSVTPGFDLSSFGGETLEILGSGFPKNKDKLKVKFADNTPCEVFESQANLARCKTKQFSATPGPTPLNMIMEVNLQTDSSLDVMIKAGVNNIVSITPNSASPVIQQDILVQMNGSYTASKIPEITATLLGVTDPAYERQLRVKSYDLTAKTLTLRFPGAPSAQYRIELADKNEKLDDSMLFLTTKLEVSSFSPSTGSTLGGTLMTINGEHFGRVPTDSPVKVGDHYCFIETISEFQITCRIDELNTQPPATVPVIVFAKASEEMVCTGVCDFDYVAPTASVTGISCSFDPASNEQMCVVSGTNLPIADLVGTELYLDGFKQETVEVTATFAKFKVIGGLKQTSSSDIKIYFAEGIPSGANSIYSVQMEPKLVSLTPQNGSAGGSLIEVNGSGFGLETQNLNLWHVRTNQSLCETVTPLAYGKFLCKTLAIEVTATDTINLYAGISQASCGNTITPTECTLVQSAASSPTISSVVINNPQTLSMPGTNYPSSADYEVTGFFDGIEAIGGVFNTPTEVSLGFMNGVPLTSSAQLPTLIFKSKTTNEGLYAITSGVAGVQPANINTSQSPSVSCSFAGGCELTLTGDGLTSTLLKTDSTTNQLINTVTVCGELCEVIQSASTVTQATCRIPQAVTTYSQTNFNMVQSGPLMKPWTGTAPANELLKLSDGNNKDDMNDSSAFCNFEIQADAGKVLLIDEEIKIFFNNMQNKTPFIDGGLRIQTSNDGTFYTSLREIGEEIHDGWVSYSYKDAPVSTKFLRFQGAMSGSCRIGQVKVIGKEVVDDNNPSFVCPVELTLHGNKYTTGQVTYESTMTPLLDSITPRFGSVLGSETITFDGSNFGGATLANTNISIDGRNCAVQSATATQITCLTADKPYQPGKPTLSISIGGVGNVALQQKKFLYVSRWSDTETWSGDLPPLEGEMISVPSGQHLLVDIDNPPRLSALVVEGSLIFPEHPTDLTVQRTFDAGYIMVKGGYLEVGTEEMPYRGKLTITLHGDENSPYLPLYGNKVLAVRYGNLEMHGAPRSHVWTNLKSTANVGDTSITLNDISGPLPLDWAIGEEIVVASTDYDGRHAEKRTISGLGGTPLNPVISFTEPLLYKHFAATETYGGVESIDMRAEVGLLTRNVVFRGDPQTSAANRYGAHIMMASPGDESVRGRIENCEFFDVGQAFKLGRYPIHFHMIGSVQQSYIKNNSIHQTYNRAVTIHGVHYLQIVNNLTYMTMGHTIFIEDAAETKNLIDSNCVIDTRASNSLLNTDATPASFWITHPDNIFRNNHAAGSDRYGYWFDLQTTAIGPSFDPTICPDKSQLGEFRDNVAHSNGRYGLRIFHNLIPRTKPCSGMTYDATDPLNPYPTNPPIIAEFHNLTSYKNNRNGAIAERIGAVQFHNFKTADNLLAGMEVSLSEDIIDGYAKIVGGLVIGKSQGNSESLLDSASPRGIITPRTENFTIDGTKFYNFNWNDAAGLGDCSHCFHSASTDSGARTVTLKNLEFDALSVTRKVKYQYPNRGIWYDETGGLTGTPNTFASANHLHLQQPECTLDEAVFDGVYCDSTVQIRRIAFSGYDPGHFRGQPMRIAQLSYADQAAMESAGTLEAFLDDLNSYSFIFWKEKLKPSNGWAVPFVTNHRYRVHFERGLDFNKMNVERSQWYSDTDLPTFFSFNFTDSREAVNFTDLSTNDQIMNNTMVTDPFENGQNRVLNDTATRQIDFVVSGVPIERNSFRMRGLRCLTGTCNLVNIIDVPIPTETSYWSNPSTWKSGKVPVAGDYVDIDGDMNVVLDIETPVLDMLVINGRLSFLDDNKPIHLKAKHIFVRAGELLIGSSAEPFQAEAKITLHGLAEEQTLVIDGAIEAGNKVLANTGLIELHGKSRSRNSRLQASVYSKENMAIVDQNLDWQAGDKLYFAPTNLQWEHSEYREIQEYLPDSGMLTLTEPFEFFHYGDVQSTASEFDGIDMRGEVVLLTRNVQILGEDVDNWGHSILTLDRIDNEVFRQGKLIFDSVEVSQAGQPNTYHAAIRFEGATGTNGMKKISNSVVSRSKSWSLLVTASRDIQIVDSDFIGAQQFGVNLKTINDVTIDNIFVADVKRRVWKGGDNTIDKEACVAYCSWAEPDRCTGNSLKNSVAVGCPYAGFVAPGHDCGDSSSETFKDNMAHSIDGTGAHIYPDPTRSTHTTCYEASNFKAYKARQNGMGTHYRTQELRVRDMTFVDNEKGLNLQASGERDMVKIRGENIKSFGEDELRNLDCPQGNPKCYCPKKMGFMLSTSNTGAKELHPTMASSLPIYKIKSDGTWGGNVLMRNLWFENFRDTTNCGSKQRVFMRNPYSADYTPKHSFDQARFNDVAETAFAYLEAPNPGWANPTDCGNFPCTAPQNILLQFEDTIFSGQSLASAIQDFQVVYNLESAADMYADCTSKEYWNAQYCRNKNLGVLLFESLDSDKRDRSVQPVKISGLTSGYYNELNSFMDHVWDGFYTGQVRLSRFPAQIETGEDYEVRFTGTPPKAMRFTLQAESSSGIMVKIPYASAMANAIFVGGKEIPYTQWDSAQGRHGELSKSFCGENRYVGIENFSEFYLTPGCTVNISTKDSIMTSVRLNWTLDEFYADGGVTTFTDRVAAALGIHASLIKTVAVYEGSVIAVFQIIADEEVDEPAKDLHLVHLNLMDQIKRRVIDFGAPILSAISGGNMIEFDKDNDEWESQTGNLFDDMVEITGQENQGDQEIEKKPKTKIQTVTEFRYKAKDVTNSMRYLIVLLIVISVALVSVISWSIARLCTKEKIPTNRKIQRKLSAAQPAQFVFEDIDSKDIFSARSTQRKQNQDDVQHRSQPSQASARSTQRNLNYPGEMHYQTGGLCTEASLPTARSGISSREAETTPAK